MGWDGTKEVKVYFRYKANKTHYSTLETQAQELVLPARRVLPAAVGQSVPGSGKIPGTDTSMEYRKQGTQQWLMCDKGGQKYLKTNTYEVRYSVDESKSLLAGQIETFEITDPMHGYDWFNIGSALDMVDFSNWVSIAGCKNWNARLTDNIDMSGVSDYYSIGDSDDCFIYSSTISNTCGYRGIFDGCGYVISNMAPCTKHEVFGMFGTVSGTVMNLGINNINSDYRPVATSEPRSFGGVCGQLVPGGVVRNCYVMNSSMNIDYSGGIVGCNYGGTIENSYSYSCNINSYYGWKYAGGIAGQNKNYYGIKGTIRNCYTDLGYLSGTVYLGNVDESSEANVTAERFKNGEIARKLNSLVVQDSGLMVFRNKDTDSPPILIETAQIIKQPTADNLECDISSASGTPEYKWYKAPFYIKGTSTSYPWTAKGSVLTTGNSYIPSSESDIEVVFHVGDSEKISFKWRVTSDPDDKFSFSLYNADGNKIGEITDQSGYMDWQTYTSDDLPEGDYRLQAKYVTDMSFFGYDDCAQIELPSADTEITGLNNNTITADELSSNGLYNNSVICKAVYPWGETLSSNLVGLVRVVAPATGIAAGKYTEDQSVSLASDTTGASIYYTVDGSDPDPANVTDTSPTKLYTSPIAVNGRPGESVSTTIKAIAVKNDMCASSVCSSTYTIELPKNPAPAVPQNLIPRKPSDKGASDGIISGVTDKMEYSSASDFGIGHTWNCTSTSITGLTSGNWYVRVRETISTHAGSYAQINVPEGEHTYSEQWSSDATGHWHEAVCSHAGQGLKGSFSEHSYGEYSSNNDADYFNDGTKTRTCSVCHYDDTVTDSGSRLIDEECPLAKVTIKNSDFTSLLNSITFGMFFKETQSVVIKASDNKSGIDKVKYYVSDTPVSELDIRNLSDTDWSEYDDASKPSLTKGTHYVYAKVTDQVNNVTYVGTDGVVIYENASRVTETMQFTRTVSGVQTAEVLLKGNTVKGIHITAPQGITLSTTELVAGTDYTVAEQDNVTTGRRTITFSQAYLSSLKEGSYLLTVSYNPLGETYKTRMSASGGGQAQELNDVPDSTTIALTVNKVIGNVTFDNPSAISRTYNGQALSTPDYTTNSTGTVSVEYKEIVEGQEAIGQGGEPQNDEDWVETAPTAVGNYKVRVSIAANDDYTVCQAEQSFSINRCPVTISGIGASDKTYDGTKNATVLMSGAVISPNYDGNNLGFNTGIAEFADRLAHDDKTVTFSGFSLTGTAEGNYSLTGQPAAVTADIDKKLLSITGLAVKDKQYDGLATASISDASVPALDGVVSRAAEGVGSSGDSVKDAVALVNGTPSFDSVNASDTPIGISFTDFTLTGADKDNYTLTQPSGITAKIYNNYTPVKGTDYTVTAANENGWLSGAFTVTAKNGYKVSTQNTAAGTGTGDTMWSDSITRSAETGSGSSRLTFYVKNLATGAISLAALEDYSIDMTAPTGSVTDGTNSWNSFMNAITFGVFFKETKHISISGTDKDVARTGNGSGVDKTYYILSDHALTSDKLQAAAEPGEGEDGELEWTEGTGADVSPNRKLYVYARIVDEAGNETVISSDGIVLYTDSAAVTESISFTKTSATDVTADVTLNGNTIKDISYGSTALTKGTDYTLSANGSKITFKATYLNSFAASEEPYIFSVSYNPLGVSYKTNMTGEGNSAVDKNDVSADTGILLTVSRAAGNVTITSPESINKVYDGQQIEEPEYTCNSTGNVTVEYKEITPAGNESYTLARPSKAGNYRVRVTVEQDANYAEKYAEADFTISQCPVTISGIKAADKTYDGTKTAEVVADEAVISPNYDGNNLGFHTGSAEFADRLAHDDKTVTFSGFSLTGTAEGNYSLTGQPEDVTADIDEKPLSITGLAVKDKQYDGLATASISDASVPALDGVVSRPDEGVGSSGDSVKDEVSLVNGTPSFDSVNVSDTPIGISFTDFTLTGADKDNYKLTQPSGITAKIYNNYTPVKGTDYTVTAANENDWLKGAFTVTAKSGYKVSIQNTAAGIGTGDTMWSDSITRSAETGSGSSRLTFYVKNLATGAVSLVTSEDYSIDMTAPTGSVTDGTNSWNSFMNAITFGVFFKETKHISISGTDKDALKTGNGSGVDKIYYILSDHALTSDKLQAAAEPGEGEDGELEWTEGTGADVSPNRKLYVYARIIDKAGNETVISSDGIVLYTDSATVTESISFTKTSATDVTADVTLNGNTIKDISYGSTALTKGTDYTLSANGSKITFKATYLNSFAAGEEPYIFSVSYNPLGVSYKTNMTGEGNSAVDKNNASADTGISLTVSRAAGNVTITSPESINKVYDGQQIEEPEYTCNSTGNVTVEYKKITPTGNESYTQTRPSQAGNYRVRVTVEQDANYAEKYAEADFTISQCPVTISGIKAADKTYDGTKTAEVVTDEAVISPNYDGNNLGFHTGSAAFADRMAHDDKTVTFSGFSLTGTASGNYSLTGQPEDVTADIDEKPLSITGLAVKDKQYDGLATASISEASVPALDGVVSRPDEGVGSSGDSVKDEVSLVNGTPSFDSVNASDTPIGISFTDFTLTGADKDNYTLTQPSGITAKIYNNYTPVKGTDYTVTAANANSWLKGAFTVTAKSGYKVSIQNTAARAVNIGAELGDTVWSDSITRSTETGNSSKELTFYVKNLATGAISLAVSEDYSIDMTAPAGSVSDGTNSWNSFMNAITFGVFFKETKHISISGTDKDELKTGNGSGVDKTYYILADHALTADKLQAAAEPGEGTDGELEWTEGSGADVSPNRKLYVYARIVDKAGNETVISSDGIVLYTDAAAVTKSIRFIKSSPEDATADVILNGNNVKDITNGSYKLVRDTDYALLGDGSRIVLKASYLKTLEADSHPYTINISYNPLGESYRPLMSDRLNNSKEEQIDLNNIPLDTRLDLRVFDSRISSIENTQDITGIANGSDFENVIKQLPSKTRITLENEDIVDADIEWNSNLLTNSDYNPDVILKQTFTVHGNIVLPKNIDSNGISLEVQINVTVDARIEPTAAPTTAPTAAPTTAPTAAPTTAPTTAPTVKSTVESTVKPSSEPTVVPTSEPTATPTTVPKSLLDFAKYSSLDVIQKNSVAIGKKATMKVGKNKLTVYWSKIKDADGYDLFASMCGEKLGKVEITLDNANTTKFILKKVNNKKIDNKNSYKVVVRAFKKIKGKKIYFANGLVMHVVGSNNKFYTNAKKFKKIDAVYNLRKGDKGIIKASIVKENKNKKLLSEEHDARIRYLSTNSKIATVNSKGVINAKYSGTCFIYITALNGVNKKIKVSVK